MIKLGIEHLLLPDHGWGDCDEDREVDVPVVELTFRYGRTEVRGADPCSRVLIEGDGGITTVERNYEAEETARRVLESFGAVELACLEYEPAYGSSADYIVAIDGDVHSYCSFGAYALPQLRALGWLVEIEEDYPYAALSGDEPWYAALEAKEDEPDWFSFELGVVVDGRRVSLLPALLELLDTTSEGSSLNALMRRPLKFAALATPDGRYLPVPMTRLRTVLRVVRDLHDGRVCEPSLRCDPLHLSALAGLDEAFTDIDATKLSGAQLRWEGSPELLERSEALRRPPAPVSNPTGLRATLRDYQLEGVGWLQRLRSLAVGGVLADDMGLGKTLQTIAHLVIEKHHKRLDKPALVVAPTSLAQNWVREIKKFAPHLRTVLYHGPRRSRVADKLDRSDVVVTTYPLLVRDELLTERDYHYLVLDEAQTVKNRTSKAHKAVRSVEATHRLALTGTPLENNLDELYALYEVLVPGLLGSAETFRHRFRRPIEAGDEDRLAELRRRVKPFMLRRLKESVAKELPPKTEIVRPVDLLGEQRELYESIRIAAHSDVRKVIRKKGLAASTVPVLGALLKLRQVCCDPRLVPMHAARAAKRSAKLETLMDMVTRQTADGRRILIFSQFTSMLAIIEDELRKRDIPHNKLTGSTQDRQREVDRFQDGDSLVFLISLKAGGTGLTLTAADTVIHYDPWWNPAAQAQATDRAYRIGQTKPVFVYNLIAAGSVEERIMRMQQHKRRLADAIVGQAAANNALSMEDVEDLFAPLAG
jgi:superfamily II DNA or RNA helicase